MNPRRSWPVVVGVCASLPAFAQIPSNSGQDEAEPIDEGLELEAVVVTGSRTEHRLSDAPIMTEVLTAEQIELSGANTAAELLEEQPGIDISRSYRGSGVRLQGMSSKHVLILVDGERVNGRIGGVVDLGRIPVEDIERIEIVKGPSSALYGSDAMGGVINVITRRASQPVEVDATGRYGSLNEVHFTGRVGLNRESWNTRFSGGWHSRDGFDLDPSDLTSTGSSLQQWNVANRTSYRVNQDVTVRLRASYLQRDQQGVDSNAAGAVFDRRNLTETLSATLAPEFRVAGPGKLRLSAHYGLFRDQYLLDQRESAALDKDEETFDHLGQFTAIYDRLLGDQHLLTLGLDAMYERLESPRLGPGEGERYRVGVFIQDEWTLSSKPFAVVVPALRLDLDSQFGAHPTPKVALRVDPHKTLKLRASYGMGFRAPDFKELYFLFENPSVGYVVVGNKDLTPETSHSVNVSAEYSPATWADISLNLYRNEVSDLIFTELADDSDFTDRYTYTNIASAYTQGLEAKFRVRPIKGLAIEGSYSLTDTLDRQERRPLEGRALHRGTTELRYRSRDYGFDISTRASIVGPRPFYVDVDGDGEEERVDADTYVTLDVRLAKHLGKQVTLFLGADNLLDEGDATYLPLQPRTFYGGIRGRL